MRTRAMLGVLAIACTLLAGCPRSKTPASTSESALTETLPDGIAAASGEMPPEDTPRDSSDILTLIPDPVFRAFCRFSMENKTDTYGKDGMLPAWDSDGDGKLSPGEAASVTYINIYRGHDGEKISSLTGIECFTGLTYLNCADNELTEIDLSKNTKLTHLDCSCNYDNLTKLDVSGLAALTYLDCSYNQLAALDVSKNVKLANLYCSCALTELDVSNNPALAFLNCKDNLLVELDVTKNAKLTALTCSGNRLTALDVTKNAALTSLDCKENLLTELDVAKNTKLTYLNCGDNRLTALDVTGNRALARLDCYGNLLTELDVSNNRKLKTEGPYLGLNCSGNPGNGAALPVKAWFGNDAIPDDFPEGDWEYDGKEIKIDYRRAD